MKKTLSVLIGVAFVNCASAQSTNDEHESPSLAGRTLCLSAEDANRLSVEHKRCTAEHFYVSASWGQASGDYSQGDVLRAANDIGFDVFDIDVDDTRSAWKATIGTNVTENVHVQLGYTDLGTVSAAFSTTTNEPSRFFDEASDIRPTSFDGWTVSGSYQFLRNEEWFVHAHVGLFFWDGTYDAFSVFDETVVFTDRKSSGTDVFYGVGGTWRAHEKWNVMVEWDRYDIDSEATDLLTIGLSYAL
jgi:hypothetical protein